MIVRTAHGRNNPIEISLLDWTINGIFALGCWTPFQVFLIVDISPCEKNLITILHRLADQQLDRLGIHDPMTTIKRTFDPGSFPLFLDFLGQVMSITVDAVSVTAFHSVCLHIRAVLVADLACKTLDCFSLW
jgi:hypothetical protein